MVSPVITWFLSSYHVHWSAEGRITQTTPFTSYQIEPILAPQPLSLHLHAHIRRVSGGLKADLSAFPPFFYFNWSIFLWLLSLVMCTCIFYSVRTPSKSTGKRPACRQSPRHLWSVGNLHPRLPAGLNKIQGQRVASGKERLITTKCQRLKLLVKAAPSVVETEIHIFLLVPPPSRPH